MDLIFEIPDNIQEDYENITLQQMYHYLRDSPAGTNLTVSRSDPKFSLYSDILDVLYRYKESSSKTVTWYSYNPAKSFFSVLFLKHLMSL